MSQFQDGKQSLRFTNIANFQLSQKQVYWGLFKISLQSFGNQHTQIQIFQQKVVHQYKWVSVSQINQIINLCKSLPGPTLYKIVIALTTLKLQSPFAGFLAFLVFNIPSWIMLFILGTVANNYVQDYNSTQMKLAFLGLNAATAGVMVRGFIGWVQQYVTNISTALIMICSAVIFFIYRSSDCITFCFVAGAIFSLYISIQSKSQMSERSKNLFKNISEHWLMGKVSVWIFIIVYLSLWILSSFYPNSIFGYCFVFYFSGTFSMGPAAGVFSYFYSYFTQLDLITDSQIWIGFPLSFLIPGSVINSGLYYGVLVDGIIGLMIAALFLYLPCFTSLFGILPSWRYYRNKPGIQRLTKGLICVTNGLLLGMILVSLQYWSKVDLSLTLTIFFVSTFLNYVWGFYSFAIILLGGLLANARRWGLVYYRLQADHPY